MGASCVKTFKKNKIKYCSLSTSNCNLLEKKSTKYLNSIINDGDIILFVSAIAPCKNLIEYEQNIQMIYPLIKLSKKKKFSQFIYISSDAVYADSKKKINEKSNVNPESIHGLMHQSRENLLKIYFKEILTIIRPTLIYGENDPHNGYGPNKFSRLAKSNNNIEIFGKGEELRDHIYIEDVARLVLFTIKKLKGIFNAVSGNPLNFDKIAKLIIQNFKSNSKIKYVKRNKPMPHNGFRCFDLSKLKKFNFRITKFKVGIKYLKYIKPITHD